MSWLVAAIAAQVILGTSAVFDKLLLKRPHFDPWPYTFWLSIFGLFAFVLAPFGFAILPPGLLFTALAAGALLALAIYFLFLALSRSEASSTLPLVGGLSAVATFAFAAFLLEERLGATDLLGLMALVLAGGILAFTGERKVRVRMMFFSLASALLFGFSNVLAKIVFGASLFITGFLWMKIGAATAVLLPLLVPAIRRKVFASTAAGAPAHRILYTLNRAYAGVGSLAVFFAISLAHPALVDATQSLKYAIVFLAAWFIGERFRGRELLGKAVATGLVVLAVAWLGLAAYAERPTPIQPSRPITWGLTYSAKFSRELGLDPQQTLDAILTEMNPRKIRLVAYWNDIEQEPGQYDFSDLDWQLESARQAGAEVILVSGLKVPRWPECHLPAWARDLEVEEREAALRAYLEELVSRYRGHPAIVMWQVENEPYLAFGQCPERGEDFVEREVAVVKSLDPDRTILVTDGGELGLWYRAARQGDVFGTTMYRRVYPRFIGPVFGVLDYPLPPSSFRLKERIVRRVSQDFDKRFIVSELQTEPWGPLPLTRLPIAEQTALFSPEFFGDTIEYAQAAGFEEYYLWGAEWWFWMKEQHRDPRYWEVAKAVFRSER